MDEPITHLSRQLSLALSESHAVKACAAYRSIVRLRGETFACETLSSCALESCLAAGRITEPLSYGEIERLTRTWGSHSIPFRTALDVASIVKGAAPAAVANVPRICLESIEGVSALSRRLTDEEKFEVANTLIAFAAIAHSASKLPDIFSLSEHAERLHEWINARDGTIMLSTWFSNQVRYDGGDYIEALFNAPPRFTSSGYANTKTNPGPWEFKAELAAALEGIDLANETPDTAASKTKRPML